ncbi:MAG: isoprenoid biosynthesis glyoxalase ElbB [Cytophagaceae bacterium]|jgi:enhancing lycopene biosynthesis protein 2|nr:isoprenoid biosynthesis glyoxalase ElbB [Cytophagaceae bacterium]
MIVKKKIAVVLSGNGVYDGAEIHEAVLTMLAIACNGAEYQIFAPDIQQFHVINHLTGEEMGEKRNVLVESARIARGNAQPLSELDMNDYDALIFPGGFGAAKNLSSYAYKGDGFTVNTEVENVIKSAYKAGKPIGALCIAPVILPKVLGEVMVTIGNDPATIASIQIMNGKHVETAHGEIVIDKTHRLVTTPCYMLDATIDQIAKGADNLVKAVLAMV